MISWPSGVEDGPDGLAMREVPTTSISSSLWISEEGAVRRRFYNPVSRIWVWKKELESPMLSEKNQVCININGRMTPLSVAIALAWVKRRRNCVRRVPLFREDTEIVAHNLKWHSDDGSSESDDDSCFSEHSDEAWEPFEATGKIIRGTTGYKISSRGRLKSPQGSVTRGHWLDATTRVAAVRNVGIVNLQTLQSLQDRAFSKVLPLHIESAALALLEGLTPSDFAKSKNISQSTAWSYMSVAVSYLEPPELALECVEVIVGAELLAFLKSLSDEKNEILGHSLTRLAELAGNFVKCSFSMAELRLARAAVILQKSCSGESSDRCEER